MRQCSALTSCGRSSCSLRRKRNNAPPPPAGNAPVRPIKAPTRAVKGGRGKDTPTALTGAVFSNGKKPEGPVTSPAFCVYAVFTHRGISAIYSSSVSPLTLSAFPLRFIYCIHVLRPLSFIFPRYALPLLTEIAPFDIRVTL